MKKLLTLISLSMTGALCAQVSFNVLEPSAIHGSYAHTWAEPAANSWNTPDMELVENRITGDLVLAVDDTPADSLVCEAVINGAALNGKVALIYRGECNYSLKALLAQQAGAIGAVIVNNVPGAPVDMGPGANGPLVQIPVFQVSDATGALLRGALEVGTVTVLLGNKEGFFAADIGLVNEGILLPPALAMPTWLAANPGEFSLRVGAYVYNRGNEARTDAVLRATVTKAGTILYDETSDPVAVLPGQRVFVELPTLDQDAWDGNYTLTYHTSFGATDEHEMDNTYTVPFAFDRTFAMVPTDATTGLPVTTIGIQPAPAVEDYELCLHFSDPNASRVAITGLQVYAAQNAPGDMQDELLLSRVYEWNDQFVGLSDPNFNIGSLVPVHDQEHYVPESGTFVNTLLEFDEPLVLVDDQRYLVCVNTFNPGVFLGHNEYVHMDTHEEIYDQPIDPHRGPSGWFIGFVGGPVASMGVRMAESSTIGIAEQERAAVGVHPNPGTGLFTIGLEGHGTAQVAITDATGRLVRTFTTGATQQLLDLRDEAPGIYLIAVRSDRGRSVGRLVLE